MPLPALTRPPAPAGHGSRRAGALVRRWAGRLPAPGHLARGTATMLAGEGVRILVQGVYFLLLARGLRASEYGLFAATVALCAIVVPFVGLGSGNVMIRHLATGESRAATHWANTVLLTVVTGGLVGAGVLACAPLVAPHRATWLLLACVAAAELVLAPLTSIAAQAQQGLQRMGRTAMAGTTASLGRLVGVVVLLAGPWRASAADWALIYLLTGLPGALLPVRAVTRLLGAARPDLALLRSGLGLGLSFSVGSASKSVYNDIDKAMLGRLSTADATGLYTVAYRVVDLAFTPMRAILAAALPRFFQEGSHGLGRALVITRRVSAPGFAYCLAASAALGLGAPLLPLLVGPSYTASVGALRGLAVLPLLKAAHYLAADTLTGAGHQVARTVTQVLVAVANVGLNLWLIPAHSWRGAVVASLLSDGMLAVVLWTALLVRRQRERRAGPTATSRAEA